jgi:hypothetical protein
VERERDRDWASAWIKEDVCARIRLVKSLECLDFNSGFSAI